MRFRCPNCKQSMECPDDLAGRKATCPRCTQKILIPSPPKPIPTPTNKTTLGVLEGDDAQPDAPITVQPIADSVTATKPKPPPSPPASNPFDFDVPPSSDADEDEPQARRKRNRGPFIMTLGIVSCVCCVILLIATIVFWPIAVGAAVVWPIALTAWGMGHDDLAEIRCKTMSDEGSGLVVAGYVCGIIATCVSTIILLVCGAGVIFCVGIVAFFTRQVNQLPRNGF